jgi:hypothetical protein
MRLLFYWFVMTEEWGQGNEVIHFFVPFHLVFLSLEQAENDGLQSLHVSDRPNLPAAGKPAIYVSFAWGNGEKEFKDMEPHSPRLGGQDFERYNLIRQWHVKIGYIPCCIADKKPEGLTHQQTALETTLQLVVESPNHDVEQTESKSFLCLHSSALILYHVFLLLKL